MHVPAVVFVKEEIYNIHERSIQCYQNVTRQAKYV